jgi:hypothetical protein
MTDQPAAQQKRARQEALVLAEVQTFVSCTNAIEEHVGPMSQKQKGEVLNLSLSALIGIVSTRQWAGLEFPQGYGRMVKRAVKQAAEVRK